MSAVDRQREAKKNSKLESSRPVAPTPGGAGKFRPTVDIVGQKGSVQDMYSDEFVINAFYNDQQEAINAKRAEKRIRRGRADQRAKHIPPKAVLTEITVGESITVKNLAEALKKTAADVIKRLFIMGSVVTANQEVDFDTAEIIASEYGVKAIKAKVVSAEEILFDDSDDNPNRLNPVPCRGGHGHVDHGKTSLLDAIREANIAEGEAGGITQHIGAYTVHQHDHDITFLDTPGHEAFTAMRARGAQVTDIAIIVVAADDGVMPQTVEAIHHAKAAGVSIIIAINKIDKPNANQDRVKQELTQHGIVIEEWGGDVPAVPVSAKQRQNIDQLLEMVLLTAELLELKADPTRQAKGTVVEARLDKTKGPIATLLVQRGTLNVGDAILSGSTFGHIRAMTNDKGRRIKDAGPSVPVEITGLDTVPEAGELFYVVQDERVAKDLAERRAMETHMKAIGSRNRVTLDDLFNQIQSGKVEELNLIVKADVQGSVEAIKATLTKMSTDKVKVRVIHDAVGSVTESDITLAQVANAIIIGFNVRPSQNITSMAEAAGVDMRLYRVIYEAVNDVEKAMKGLLAPTFKEVVDGHIEIRQLFKVSNVGTIGGAYVLDGKVNRNSEIRVVREGIVVHEGKLASLKRFKDDVRDVAAGYECGVMIEKFNDIQEGDIVEAFHQEQVEV
jgi:translation initiation factor IF-2